jgi:hypothetical protein
MRFVCLSFISLCSLITQAVPFDSAVTTNFKDKQELFSVNIPQGYSVQDQSSYGRSKNVLTWGNTCQIIFLSSVMNKEWDAKKAMEEKIAGLRHGAVIGSTEQITSRLASLDTANGYEFEIKKNDQHSLHGFAGVAAGRSFNYVVEVKDSTNANDLATILTSCIKNSFKVLIKENSKKTVQPLKSLDNATDQKAGIAGVENWAAAEGSIKVSGIVSNAQQVFAIINRKMVKTGDTIKIPYEGREYHFRITAIRSDARRVSVEPLK